MRVCRVNCKIVNDFQPIDPAHPKSGSPNRMPRRFAHLLLLLAAIAAADRAFAQGSRDDATRLFARLDRDRSGAVTAPEFAFVRSIDFRRLDRNNDGYLSREEFIDKRSPRNALSARARRLRFLRVRRYAEIDGYQVFCETPP